MKMNDWFKSEIRLHGDIIECNDFAYAEMSCEYTVNDIDAGDAICHAVNNHDRMADEIAELREVLRVNSQIFKRLSECESLKVNNSKESLMAFDAYLVSEALLDKHK